VDVRIHCSRRVRRQVRKSKHRVDRECAAVCQVLRFNPNYGAVIPRRAGLRKMRIQCRSQNFGKSGGYRAIYQHEIIDEIMYIVIVAIYFKGDQEDLSNDEYQTARTEAEDILGDVLSHSWDDTPA